MQLLQRNTAHDRKHPGILFHRSNQLGHQRHRCYLRLNGKDYQISILYCLFIIRSNIYAKGFMQATRMCLSRLAYGNHLRRNQAAADNSLDNSFGHSAAADKCNFLYCYLSHGLFPLSSSSCSSPASISTFFGAQITILRPSFFMLPPIA